MLRPLHISPAPHEEWLCLDVSPTAAATAPPVPCLHLDVSTRQTIKPLGCAIAPPTRSIGTPNPENPVKKNLLGSQLGTGIAKRLKTWGILNTVKHSGRKHGKIHVAFSLAMLAVNDFIQPQDVLSKRCETQGVRLLVKI